MTTTITDYPADIVELALQLPNGRRLLDVVRYPSKAELRLLLAGPYSNTPKLPSHVHARNQRWLYRGSHRGGPDGCHWYVYRLIPTGEPACLL